MADPKEIDSAIKVLQLASMGNPQAIQKIREHHAEFAKIMPLVQQQTAAAFQPGAGQVSDAEAVKAGVPAAQLAEARKVQGAAPQDASFKRYQEVLSLLAPEQQANQGKPIVMDAEVITASPRKPKPKVAKAKTTYMPMSAPEGANDEQKLGAALLNLLGGASMGWDGPMQLQEPQMNILPKPKKVF